MDSKIGPDEAVSMAVVRAVSAVENRDPVALPRLGEVVDTDALNALFDAKHDGTQRRGGRLSFVYSDCRITVENGEYLGLELLEDLPARDVHSDGD